MANDLVKRVSSIESDLSRVPSFGMEDYTPEDKEILASLMWHDDTVNPVKRKYGQWPIFAGAIEKYHDPVQRLKSMEGQYQVLAKGFSELQSEDFDSLGMSQETIDSLCSATSLFDKLFSMVKRIYESEVVMAKVLAKEKGIPAEKVVQSQPARDEIFRRILSKGSYVATDEILLAAAVMTLGTVYRSFEEMGKKYESLGIPSLTLSSIPPKEVAAHYLQDMKSFYANNAKRIYELLPNNA